jgi:hypothetical protein
MKSKPDSMLLVLIAVLLVQVGSASVQPAQQATGKVKLLREMRAKEMEGK